MNTAEKINMRIEHITCESTRTNRRSIIKSFVEQVGKKETYDEYDAMKFFDWAKQHYTGQSVVLVYSIIKWLYSKMGFNFSDIERPKYTNTNIYVMPYDDVGKLIHSIDRFSTRLKMIIAMATTYGMRRIEMLRVIDEDIDINGSKLFIRTAKSAANTQRWMYMPDEIKAVMSEYKNNYSKIPGASIISISAYFWKAAHIAGIELDRKQRIGWHAIRRSLVNELTNKQLSDNTIIRFMRWQTKDSASSILYRYRSTQTNESTMETVDKEIMSVHPFLGFWNDNNG